MASGAGSPARAPVVAPALGPVAYSFAVTFATPPAPVLYSSMDSLAGRRRVTRELGRAVAASQVAPLTEGEGMRSRCPFPLIAVAAGLALLPWARPAGAQIPEKFTNLKVLPRDISRDQLIGTMRGFSAALGVRCDFCHAQGDTARGRGLDFASDAKDEKRVARVMMKMADEINGKLIPRARIQSPAAVGCVTCHHGVERPETLADLLERTIEKDGVPAARQRYRELRDRYYGSGAYDFRPRSLDSVAEWLAESRKDLDGALAIANLSLELDPKEAETYVTLGRIQARKGDTAAAAASYRRALDLDPRNRRAEELLKAAGAGE